MIRKMLAYSVLALLFICSNQTATSAPESSGKNSEKPSGTFEKMVVSSGTVTINLDLNRLTGTRSENQETRLEVFRFEVDPNSFFTIRVFNNTMRAPDPGSLRLTVKNPTTLPEPLRMTAGRLVLEKTHSGGRFDLVMRDGKTGETIFNVEGDMFEFDSATRSLNMTGGRLLVSEELANRLGRKIDADAVAGDISLRTAVYPIETTEIVDGATRSTKLPPRSQVAPNVPNGSVPGPDIIVGDLPSMVQSGSANGYVGLGIATTSCNNGDQQVNFFSFPSVQHSVIAQNFYRMSGGTSNTDRFEQIGQGWAKHAFGANQDDDCGFGCTPSADFSHLGVGCSDPYDAGENAVYSLLGSRSWINPFTGTFPNNAANHTGHTHTGTSHRLMVAVNDLNPAMNPGATYFAEVSYDIAQEYDWCQTHAGQCNMYNNATYKHFSVSGTTSFTFASAGPPEQMTEAIRAWTGATINMIEPEPGVDGRALIGCKVTNPSAGVWHYEYALYNRNLDRGIQSFTVPLGAGGTLSNVGFHAPLNPAGFSNDGTLSNAGYSNTAWTPNQTGSDITWNSETMAQNQNANAIRWATMYNFRFDSDQPPQTTNGTIGFFKTGAPMTVEIQAPGPLGGVTPTPTPEGSITPSPTPGGSPGETPTPTPGASVTPTPSGMAHALNLSTRLNVGAGNDVGIGGFIVTGSAPKQVLLRGIGPSLASVGIANPLSDPVLELHGPAGFNTITNNNWREMQESAIVATGIAPINDLESAILVTLDPGAYTAILSGNQTAVGIGLVELYDLTQGVTSKLANISTRALVGTGNNLVVAGFILGDGSENDPILVRAVPSSGVPNPLPNPMLDLRDSSGNLIASGVMITVTLAPGAYTALLKDANNETGIGLIEVYDNPSSSPTPTPSPGGGTPTPTASPGGETPTPTPPGPTPTGPPITPTPSPTPAGTPGTCTENFDSVTSPALPPGWAASNPIPGDGVMFITSTTSPDSAPNDAFVPDQNGISDKVLDRANVTIQSASATLMFRNNFDSEVSGGVFWDGGVLEVSAPNISNGDFLDVTDAHIGGVITAGPYTGEISGDASNPLAGRMAWSGSSGGYIDTTITLGSSLVGQTVTFRWRFGSDEAVAAPGWRIDNLSITGASCP